MKWFCLGRFLFFAGILINVLPASNSLFRLLKCHRFGRKCGILCAFDVQRCECPAEQWKKLRQSCSRSLKGRRLICASQKVRKAGRCYKRKKPGEFCKFSDQCIDEGPVQYSCIGNLCQIPPECSPGHVSIGAECLPYAVTGLCIFRRFGGECVHPIQCLAGSVCIKGRCRGPCEENQVFIEDGCVQYEGAGCVARACVRHKCPRAFPSCNYVPQKNGYLCCERQIRSTAQCPDPLSIPQLSQLTNEVVDCMTEQCGPGFTCQFSNNGKGRYICCSIPSQQKQNRKQISNQNSFLWSF